MRNHIYPRFAEDVADLRSVFSDMASLSCAPLAPVFTRASRFYTQGSCFAASLAQQLACRGIYAEHTGVIEEVNSPAANAGFFQSEDSAAVRRNLPGVDGFIFTLGIAPQGSTVTDNAKSILSVINSIWSVSRDCKVVLTVSPVPLNRVDNGSAIMADCVSKSKLRAAVEMVRETLKPEDGVYYWPTFEFVRWVAPHVAPAYGKEDGMLRHVNADLINIAVDEFVGRFIGPAEAAA